MAKDSQAIDDTANGIKIVMRADPALKDEAFAKAKEEGHTLTWVLKRALEDYLAGTWSPARQPAKKGKGAKPISK
jgi:hypothetical protein